MCVYVYIQRRRRLKPNQMWIVPFFFGQTFDWNFCSPNCPDSYFQPGSFPLVVVLGERIFCVKQQHLEVVNHIHSSVFAPSPPQLTVSDIILS
jgi:hypothetical protein